MESRSVYRNPQIVYEDLYYIWTYKPTNMKSFFSHTKKRMYPKHICGIGFYTRYHAKHIVGLMLGEKALSKINIIKGSELIREGITTLPKKDIDRVYVDDPHTEDGSRKLRKWIYPQEFKYDKHRRRHFILYLVKSAEDKGEAAFDKKYKKYYHGHRPSYTVMQYLRKLRRFERAQLREIRARVGLPSYGVKYNRELLREYNQQKAQLAKERAAKNSTSSIIK